MRLDQTFTRTWFVQGSTLKIYTCFLCAWIFNSECAKHEYNVKNIYKINEALHYFYKLILIGLNF